MPLPAGEKENAGNDEREATTEAKEPRRGRKGKDKADEDAEGTRKDKPGSRWTLGRLCGGAPPRSPAPPAGAVGSALLLTLPRRHRAPGRALGGSGAARAPERADADACEHSQVRWVIGTLKRCFCLGSP